jgi:hypothetical protein
MPHLGLWRIATPSHKICYATFINTKRGEGVRRPPPPTRGPLLVTRFRCKIARILPPGGIGMVLALITNTKSNKEKKENKERVEREKRDNLSLCKSLSPCPKEPIDLSSYSNAGNGRLPSRSQIVHFLEDLGLEVST